SRGLARILPAPQSLARGGPGRAQQNEDHAAVGETPPFRAVVGEVGIRESDATLEFLAIAPASRAGQRRALCPEALDERDPHVGIREARPFPLFLVREDP